MEFSIFSGNDKDIVSPARLGDSSLAGFRCLTVVSSANSCCLLILLPYALSILLGVAPTPAFDACGSLTGLKKSLKILP